MAGFPWTAPTARPRHHHLGHGATRQGQEQLGRPTTTPTSPTLTTWCAIA